MPSDVASAILPVKEVGLCFDLTCLLATAKQANPYSPNRDEPPMQVGYASDGNRFASIHVTIVGLPLGCPNRSFVRAVAPPTGSPLAANANGKKTQRSDVSRHTNF